MPFDPKSFVTQKTQNVGEFLIGFGTHLGCATQLITKHGDDLYAI